MKSVEAKLKVYLRAKKMNVLRVTMRSQIIRFRGKGMSASIRTQSRGYAFHVFKAALMG